MTEEVWWASRDNYSDVVEFRDRKPVKVHLPCGDGYWRVNDDGLFISMHISDFEKISSVNLAAGECVAIRPLRIERVEGK